MTKMIFPRNITISASKKRILLVDSDHDRVPNNRMIENLEKEISYIYIYIYIYRFLEDFYQRSMCSALYY